MNRFIAGLITIIVMSLMAGTALYRSRTPIDPGTSLTTDSRFQDSPFGNQDQLTGATACVEGLLASARAGDLGSYLNAFGGPLKERLEREANEIGRDAFALRLRRAGEARKGHAIFMPQPDGDGSQTVRVTVESTFPDRIERQVFCLEQKRSGWLITEIETAREHVPTIPLGSLATYEEPEGAPVGARLRCGR